jgi:ABC-type sugar transport system ATPase subunit
MVFQSYALYPHMTVAQNIGFGLKIAGETKAAIRTRVLEIATLLKLDKLLSRKPKALSGGQRQRVAIGRALARKPRIFLFDEPLSNLDASLRAEMRVELVKLHKQLGNTMIYVTHDQVEGMTLADAMVVMNASAVEQSGAPLDLFNRPNNKFVARFLGQPPINIVKTSETSRSGGTLLLGLPGGEKLAISDTAAAPNDLDGVEVGIRPEDLTVSTAENGLRLTLDVVEQLGNETILYGHLVDKQPVTVRLAGQSKFKSDQELRLEVAAGRILLFDGNGATVHMNGS